MANDISSLSGKDEKKLESLWNKCSKSDYILNDDISTTVELYHATTIENRESILACGEFWVPSRKYAIENACDNTQLGNTHRTTNTETYICSNKKYVILDHGNLN